MSKEALPLFPLPLVLFPGVGIPLHIFEPRYRQMLADIMERDRRFGLLYSDPDESGPFMDEKGRVGTIAVIKKHQPLPDGRSLILVKGLDRFSILHEVSGEAPYYQARVVPFEDEPVKASERLVDRRKQSLNLLRTVLETLPHAPEALPSFDPEKELSFKLAAVARMDPAVQQEILEMRTETARLDELDPVFRFGVNRWREFGGAEA